MESTMDGKMVTESRVERRMKESWSYGGRERERWIDRERHWGIKKEVSPEDHYKPRSMRDRLDIYFPGVGETAARVGEDYTCWERGNKREWRKREINELWGGVRANRALLHSKWEISVFFLMRKFLSQLLWEKKILKDRNIVFKRNEVESTILEKRVRELFQNDEELIGNKRGDKKRLDMG